jgi:hypothetical protein
MVRHSLKNISDNRLELEGMGDIINIYGRYIPTGRIKKKIVL